jgi:hypothetical protein
VGIYTLVLMFGLSRRAIVLEVECTRIVQTSRPLLVCWI